MINRCNYTRIIETITTSARKFALHCRVEEKHNYEVKLTYLSLSPCDLITKISERVSWSDCALNTSDI
jgi:hypothetical protein